jgi:ABC-type multidrug transport system fused ATPase/permease subunit
MSLERPAESLIVQEDGPDPIQRFVERSVWNGLVKSDEDVEYLYRVGRRFLFWQNMSNVTQVLFSTVAVATILGQGPKLVYIGLSSIVATVALLSILFRFSEKHAAAVSMEGACRAMSREWRKLWEELGATDDQEILSRVRALEEKVDVVTSEQAQKMGNVKERLQEKAVKYTHLRIRQEFDL